MVNAHFSGLMLTHLRVEATRNRLLSTSWLLLFVASHLPVSTLSRSFGQCATSQRGWLSFLQKLRVMGRCSSRLLSQSRRGRCHQKWWLFRERRWIIWFR
jgi:hypothetical protein